MQQESDKGSVFFPDFFAGNEYYIDEKISVFRFRNQYKVYDENANQIGGIVQRIVFGHKLLRIFVKKAVLPFTFYIVDNNQNTLLTIERGWTFWMSKVTISDEKDNELGYFKQKFRLVKPSFKIYDVNRKLMAVINGDWKAWNFTIINKGHVAIGEINKNWQGLRRQLFTTTDKYHVKLYPEVESVDRRLVVATAITIDMILKATT